MEQTKPSQSLPDNAYRELKPGEEYVPMMPADAKPKEVTPYSVTMIAKRLINSWKKV